MSNRFKAIRRRMGFDLRLGIETQTWSLENPAGVYLRERYRYTGQETATMITAYTAVSLST